MTYPWPLPALRRPASNVKRRVPSLTDASQKGAQRGLAPCVSSDQAAKTTRVCIQPSTGYAVVPHIAKAVI